MEKLCESWLTVIDELVLRRFQERRFSVYHMWQSTYIQRPQPLLPIGRIGFVSTTNSHDEFDSFQVLGVVEYRSTKDGLKPQAVVEWFVETVKLSLREERSSHPPFPSSAYKSPLRVKLPSGK